MRCKTSYGLCSWHVCHVSSWEILTPVCKDSFWTGRCHCVSTRPREGSCSIMSRTPDAAACALSEQRLIAADRAARAYCITKKHARAPVYLSQGLPCVASQQPDDAAPASFSVAMPTSLLGTRSPSTRSQTLTTLRKQRPWKSQVRLFVCRSLFGASKDTEYCIREEAQNIFLSWTRKNGVHYNSLNQSL
jgi:hypothetical protein